MYSVFKPNNLDDEEIIMFVQSSSSSILQNETPSTIPELVAGKEGNLEEYQKQFLKHFKTPDLVYKQTKNGEPIYLRKAMSMPEFIEEGYLSLEMGLINFYKGSKSFIYEQEFWDAWHDYLKEEGYIGWITYLTANTETTVAYQKVIDMGLLGDDVHVSVPIYQGARLPKFTKMKVTF